MSKLQITVEIVNKKGFSQCDLVYNKSIKAKYCNILTYVYYVHCVYCMKKKLK